jgi:hypothetical protein
MLAQEGTRREAEAGTKGVDNPASVAAAPTRQPVEREQDALWR